MEKINGIILLNKPEGKTSHDMVARIRRLTGIRRVGHTGTLDPMATGVLPICVGNATKTADMLTASDKRYQAVVALGAETDTLDREGTVLKTYPVTCTAEDIYRAAEHFTGEIRQLPPMYSAIKKDGKKLYELAREGKTVEREHRNVTIYSIEIIKIDLEAKRFTMNVHCSKGTYIRTLCEDMGRYLHTGAYMDGLIRLESGGFPLSRCRCIEELDTMAAEGRLLEALIPTDEVFDYPKVSLNEKQSERAKNGVAVSAPGICEGKLYRVYDFENRFIAVSRVTEGRLKLMKAFW